MAWPIDLADVDPGRCCPFMGCAYVGEHRRVQARFRTGPGRGVRRTTLHAAGGTSQEQDMNGSVARVATIPARRMV